MTRYNLKKSILLLTFYIFALFLFLSSVYAFSFNLSINPEKTDKGGNITFQPSFIINDNERIPINFLMLELIGPINVQCKFYPNATIIFGCISSGLQQVFEANFTFGNRTGNFSSNFYDFGSGFGYGSGEGMPGEILSYNIEINSSNLAYGNYETFFRVKLNDSVQITHQGNNLSIAKPINISNISSSLTCAFVTSNITLSAFINGSINRVFIALNTNGTWINITIPGTYEGVYFYIVNSSQLLTSTTIFWQFFVEDTAGDITSSSVLNKYINARTSLSVNPPIPDGLNGWFITEPQFTLTNFDATQIFYKWDSLADINYISPFGLEDAPNNADITGGPQTLYYWSNGCGNESLQTYLLKSDFQDPFITNLLPPNNSIVYNNLKPTIESFIDEVYGGNSGIDPSTIWLALDGINVTTILVSVGPLDYKIRHNPISPLSLGIHNVTIYASDRSGRVSQLSWSFLINTTSLFNLTVYSPENTLYDNKRVAFNITTIEEVSRLEYINYNERNPRWQLLCRDCKEYGLMRKRTQNLLEGRNNITIRASDNFGNVQQNNISIFIDSKPPKILSIVPNRNSVINGSNFFIKYTEENLNNIILFWNPNVTLQNCPSGINKNCSISLNLSDFHNSFIDFSFELNDTLRIVRSRSVRVFVDTVIPKIILNAPKNNGTYGRKVPFNISVGERVLLEYYDYFDSSPRWKTMCTNCDSFGLANNKTITFKPGNHNLLIRAVDKAGNSDTKAVNITVI